MPPSTSLISREGPCCSTSAWVFRRWSVSGTICKPSTARASPASRRTSSTRGGASPVEGLITIIGLESHPEGGKQGAYDRISFFDPAGLASGAPVVSVDREKKEAVGRQARQRRSRVAARRRAHRGPRPRPLPAGAREGRPLRSPRRGRRRGLGERRHVPRHGAPRRRLPTVMVGPDGEREVRRGGQAPPGLRRRRVQRQPRHAPGARAAALLRPQPHGGGVRHLPPGTSKWNKVEHRIFTQVTRNWRGGPPGSLEVIAGPVASTTTSRGLRVMREIDPRSYEAGIRVTDEETGTLDISREDFHGEWNYVIREAS